MNKLTKLLSVFVIAGAIGTGIAGAAGCSKPKHDHEDYLKYEQTADGTKHYQVCTEDDYKTEEVAHVWGADDKCVCGATKPSGGTNPGGTSGNEGLVIPADVTGILIEGVTAETITLSETKKSHTIDKSAIKVYFATGTNADVKGTEVPAANVVLELKDGKGAAVSSWENITKDGAYKVNASIKDATMASGATAQLGDLKATVTVTISNPVIADSLVVKSGTLTQAKSVQDKMSADWTYTVTLANGDVIDYTEAVTVTVDTQTVGKQTATLVSGSYTGTVEVTITEAENHSETYAYNSNAKEVGTISADSTTATPVELFKSANGNTKLEVVGAKVEANGNSAAQEIDGKYFANRTPLNGATFTSTNSLQSNQRYFILTTEGAAKLTIYWSRNSSDDERGVSVFNSTVTDGDISKLTPGATTIAKETVPAGTAADVRQAVQKMTVNIPAAGTYWITTANNQNVYFYYIELTTEFEGEGTDVVLEDGANALAKMKVSHTTSDYKQQFTVGDTFTVDSGYSVNGTFVTANTAKKSEQTLTDVTYWIGNTQLIPDSTVLSADLFTALGDNKITVKYGSEAVTGDYTIFVDSAVTGVTGIKANIKNTVETEVDSAEGKITLNKTDIETAIVGENTNAAITATTVKYRLNSAAAGSETEITESVELGVGNYVIIVSATVTDSVANKSADFEATVELMVTVAGSSKVISADTSDVSQLNGNTIDDEKITITGGGGGYAATACAAGKAKSADNKYEFEKGWFPGGGSRTVTITAKEACTVKILYTVCNGDFSTTTSAVDKSGELQWVLTPKDGEAQAAVSDTNIGDKTSTVVYVSASITLAEGDSILLSVTGDRLILFGVEVA